MTRARVGGDFSEWVEVGSLPAGRSAFTMISLADKIFILGGHDGSYTESILTSTDGENWEEDQNLTLETGSVHHTAISTATICT